MGNYIDVVKYLESEVMNEKLPGAVLAVGTANEVLLQKAVGFSQVYPCHRPMKLDTLFDIASLTKVVATLPAILKLVERGDIRLDANIKSYIEEYSNKNEITVWHLLTHTSGLPPALRFYRDCYCRSDVINQLFKVNPVAEIGSQVIYSDLNFMLLGLIIERISRQSISEFTINEIYKPLNMVDSCFNPTSQMIKKAAATEYREDASYYACGEVHDRNAKVMGGASGHAGLFSTISDLINYSTMLLNKGVFNNVEVFSTDIIQRMMIEQTCEYNESRGLGWEIYHPKEPTFGGCFNTIGYGHTGFTGTSIYINPHNNIFVILLTNRLHYGRTDDIQRIRRNVHNLISKFI